MKLANKAITRIYCRIGANRLGHGHSRGEYWTHFSYGATRGKHITHRSESKSRKRANFQSEPMSR